MRLRERGPVLAVVLALLAGPASAVSIGQSDTFQGGTSGWGSGAANPSPPTTVPGGGPAGANDPYLLVTATGTPGPGGKLVAISGPHWAGDYTSAGVTAIGVALNNFGPNALHLRLFIEGPLSFAALSAAGVAVPAGSGWVHVVFPVAPDALVGAAGTALAGVVQFRLYHGTATSFPGADIAAQLGVDNITAVPEPVSGAMLAAGLVLLAAAERRLRRRPVSPAASAGGAGPFDQERRP
jgi:hypothetical protein